MDDCFFKCNSQVGSKGRHDTYQFQRTVSLSPATHPEQATLIHLLIQASPYLVFSAVSVNALKSSHNSLLFTALVHLSSPYQGRKGSLDLPQSVNGTKRLICSKHEGIFSTAKTSCKILLFFSMTCHHLPSSQDVVWKDQWVNSMWNKLYWGKAEI